MRRTRNDIVLSRLILSGAGGCTIMVKGRIGNIRRRIVSRSRNYVRVPRCNAGRSLGMSIATNVIV